MIEDIRIPWVRTKFYELEDGKITKSIGESDSLLAIPTNLSEVSTVA